MTKQALAHKAGTSVSFPSDPTSGKANPSLKIMAAVLNDYQAFNVRQWDAANRKRMAESKLRGS